MKALAFYNPALHLRHVIQPIPSVITTATRNRVRTAFQKKQADTRYIPSTSSHPASRPHLRPPSRELWLKPQPPIHFKDLPTHLASRAPTWSRASHVQTRLARFGIPSEHVVPALSAFVYALRQETVLEMLDYRLDMLDRLSHDLADHSHQGPIDVTLTRLFYEWASQPSTESTLKQFIPLSTIQTIRELHRSANMSNPASEYPFARASPRRKVIMHVGPTNSGKTHNALRALAAAKSGCYAGPLRLLAHEIFTRLNNGQIVPLGEEPGHAEPDPRTNIEATDAEGRAIVRKEGDKRFVRPCNLVTGEEQIFVGENVGLVSCTVEMVSTLKKFDVVVVDEIQMLADDDRGGAWTNAVLGVDAVELHLCGEEAAVPLVQTMLKDTGDELIVNRYERLTPLKVGKSSLGGSLKEIRKGDCVVAFSRTGIFKLKSDIEKQTGLKCAVVYGGLPAELRNEQAFLFNDPKSGYDVIVGSDAIGMGLNLKIKRVIFSSVIKTNGRREVVLSPPQIKQIAGRAGRYGLHGDADAGGIATTLYEADLPTLRKALALPPTALRLARVRPTDRNCEHIKQALPWTASSSTLLEVVKFVAKMGPAYEAEECERAMTDADKIEAITSTLTNDEKETLQAAPVHWRDPTIERCMFKFIEAFQRDIHVDVKAALNDVGLLETLEEVLEAMKSGGTSKPATESLKKLETMHKMLVVYLWLSYRLPVGFADREKCQEIKKDTEKAIWWTLGELPRKGGFSLSGSQARKPSRARPGDLFGPLARDQRQPGFLQDLLTGDSQFRKELSR